MKSVSSIKVISPIDQSVLAEIPCLSEQQADEAIRTAHKAFPMWKGISIKKRVSIIEKFCELFEEKKEVVETSITSQMGRPSRYGQGEIKGVIERTKYMLSVAEECLEDDIIEYTPGVVKRYQRKEPLGPVLIVAAWNYPYLTAINNVIPALLAGNTILLKQSPQTPRCADIMVDTLREAGVPHDVIQSIHVQDEVADYIVRHPLIQFVSFTGSVAVGKQIRKTIGSNLELGGKDPAYVLPDSDLDYAVNNIIDGAFFNSGQCCCAIERCYVHEDVYDAFIKRAVEVTKGSILGNPNQSNTTLGPMANIRFANNVRSHMEDAIQQGAQPLLDTHSLFPLDNGKSEYVAPQLFVNVNHSMKLMKEETFGPVLGIMKVASDEEAIQLMNDSPYGLTASIWTKDEKKAMEIGDRIECGTWFMNRCDYIDPALCWVGVKDSGAGFSMSKHAYSQFTRYVNLCKHTLTLIKFHCSPIDPNPTISDYNKNKGDCFPSPSEDSNTEGNKGSVFNSLLNPFVSVSERYPMCSQLIADNSIPEFVDNLYLDMNGIIHNCSHNNNESVHFRITEEQIWIGVFNYIDHLFSKIKPKKVFFLAIDGVAPRAKMNQQRSRRFRTAKDAEENRAKALMKGEELPAEDPFDSNCITPGTAFMKKLTVELRYFIAKKMTEDANWRGIEVVLSGPEVPGEGEHKIMEFIRLSKAQTDYDPNTRHCLYGLDADLIMLGLLSHDPHFALLREEVTFGRNNKKKQSLDQQNFYLMHLSLMREYLDMEFQSIAPNLSFPYDFERVLDDFILLALFVGNDFLPNLPNLHINEGALGLMFNIYKEVLPTCDGYLQEGGDVNMSRLQKILDQISAVVEKEAFEADSIDSLYLAGKRENGHAEREMLHKLEKKKAASKKLVMTETQEFIFRQIHNIITKGDTSQPAFLHFDKVFRSRDRAFVDTLVRSLNISHSIIPNNKDKTTDVEILFESPDDSDSEPDEEALIARDRVLKKYESAEIIPDTLSKEEIAREEEAKFEVEFKQWKANYYKEKMDIDIDDQEQMDGIVGSYIIGIQWVLQYYYNGVASWGWYYPYHYAPKISDLKNVARFENHKFELGQPFKPYEQLMGVLPSLSKNLLPVAYQDLMTNTTSPIIDFYPTDFDTDMNGKKQEWEAIVKIPFIDEQRLLDAMKSREHRLTKEEREMARIGVSYKFTYDEELAKKEPEELPVYPSPLPGVFPDIHQCLVRESTYNLPTLDNGLNLRKGLLPGAKFGKDALAGFPSLHTIPFTYALEHHGVNVFQQDSRSESIVISLKNRYEHANIEELAKLFLYRSIYVHYPYLQEAVVIGVSDEEKKFYVNFKNGKKQILQHMWDAKEREVWNNKMGRAKYMPSKRLGLNVGDIEIGFHVCVLNGMHQTEEGALVKEFVNPSMEDLVPIQTVVIKVNNPDPRFIEKPAPPVEVDFPIKSTVFFLGSKFLGVQMTVVGHRNDCVDVEMTVPVDEEYHVEPEFGHEMSRMQEKEVRYIPIHALAQILRLPVATLSKLSSSLTVNDRGGMRINVGLNLKFEGRGEKVLGYSRKHPDGFWEFSPRAVQLIKEYVEKHPEFIDVLSAQKGGGMLSIDDFKWTKEGSKVLRAMKEFVNSKKVDSLTRAPFDTEELDEKYVHLIEEAAVAYHEKYDDLEMKKIIIKGVPRKVLLKPADAGVKLNYQTFSLGDRVIYVCDSGAVPIGTKGTVVTVTEKIIDVVFDITFMSGTTLNNR
ncbi:exoribonuclease 1 [Pilobolus umbonatus]|nr:exoribonuclease 1 [Pilobolus umbonatus]